MFIQKQRKGDPVFRLFRKLSLGRVQKGPENNSKKKDRNRGKNSVQVHPLERMRVTPTSEKAVVGAQWVPDMSTSYQNFRIIVIVGM